MPMKKGHILGTKPKVGKIKMTVKFVSGILMDFFYTVMYNITFIVFCFQVLFWANLKCRCMKSQSDIDVPIV